MKYKIVPFRRVPNPAEDLNRIINENAVDGFEYVNHQYSDKLTPGSAGCFGFGAKPDTIVHVGFVIFGKS